MQTKNKKSLINFRAPAQNNNFMAPDSMQHMSGPPQMMGNSKNVGHSSKVNLQSNAVMMQNQH